MVIPFSPKIQNKISPAWQQQSVQAVVKAAQKGEISYVQFLQQIADSGVLSYTVDIPGKQVTYFGKDKNSYVQAFAKKLCDFLAKLKS